jgi:hypothetical protein
MAEVCLALLREDTGATFEVFMAKRFKLGSSGFLHHAVMNCKMLWRALLPPSSGSS